MTGRWLVVVAALVLLATTVAAATTTDLPAKPLSDKTDTWAGDERVTVDYQRIQASLTISETADGAGLEGFRYTDVDTTYVRLDYDEGVERTLRIEIPADYFRPRPKEGLEAADSGVTADLSRAADGEATIMKVHVDGATDAAFPISKEAGIVFSVRDGVRSRVSNQTGVTIPSLSSAGEWTVVNDSLSPQSTYRIEHPNTDGELAVQYDAIRGAGERWVPAAPCDTEDTALCTLDRVSNDSATVVLVDTADPPRMRYQMNPGIPARLRGAMNDIQQIPARLEAAVDELMNGLDIL